MNNRLLAMATLILALGATSALQSCADQQQTTQTTVSSNASDATGTSTAPPTTTTTTTTTEEPDTVLGATLNAVGTVILFPFRVIGDAFELLV